MRLAPLCITSRNNLSVFLLSFACHDLKKVRNRKYLIVELLFLNLFYWLSNNYAFY